jgi:flagellar hook protein FlgE
MSLFGAINTAVSGLTAQSTSFGNISEDVANSQTVGFKRVDTSFTDYLTTSTATNNVPGAVVATPDYVNNIQGTVTQTDNPLGMAIAGQGFFAVSQPTGEVNGVTTYNPQQFYTRAGDFTMNATGYLVNSAGQYLNGWTVNPATGIADQNALVPIQVNQSTYNPVATQNVTLAANLPATPASGTATNASPLSSQITVYDALGTAHSVDLNWVQNQNSSNTWTVQVEVPDAKSTLGNGTTPNYTFAGQATVTFGNVSSTLPPAGTIESITPVPAPTATPGGTAQSLGAKSDSFGTGSSDGNGGFNYAETKDDGSGSATGLATTNWDIPAGYITTTTSNTTSGTASDTTTPPTVNADGTITFAETIDNLSTTTVRTITIPPSGGGTLALPVNNGVTNPGQYIAGATAQAPATLGFTTNFGSGNQTISLNLGTYGGTTGVTQFAGSTYSLLGLTQDGVAPGSFSGVTAQDNGNIVVNYNNGQTRTIAQIPLVTFNAPNSLQGQNGQSFTATPGSGSPLAEAASSNGAGNLVVGSVEGSNVDIATEFSNLIVAQQAYSSNAKVVTTANTMLQATLQMVT